MAYDREMTKKQAIKIAKGLEDGSLGQVPKINCDTYGGCSVKNCANNPRNYPMSKLIKRTYRITTEQDKVVKKNKKIFGSESNYIRTLINEGIIFKK